MFTPLSILKVMARLLWDVLCFALALFSLVFVAAILADMFHWWTR